MIPGPTELKPSRVEDVDMEIILISLKDTLSIIMSVLSVMFLGLFGVEILMRLGLMGPLEVIGRPLARAARLPPESVPAFMASIGSLVAGNVILARYREDGVITDRELVLCSVFNTVPLHFKETLTYQLPVILPLLGPRLCMIYIATFWLAGILKLGYVVCRGRQSSGTTGTMPSQVRETRTGQKAGGKFGLIKAVQESLQAKWRLFAKMALTLMIVTFLVQLPIHAGIFNNLEPVVGPFTDRLGLPAAAVAPLSLYIVSPIVGITAMSSLMRDGMITEFQAIAALLAGGFLMVPVLRLRGTLPRYVSVLGWRNGLRVISITTVLSLLARLIMLVWVILFFK